MAPPGRRRTSRGSPLLYVLSISTIICLLASSLPTAAAAVGAGVIGIDVGTEYLTAALVKPGVPLDIILTKDSKRKEAASVAFKLAREANAAFPERFYGGDANALAARFPNDVYVNLKSLLGIPIDTGIQGSDNRGENIVETYKSRFPDLNVQAAPGGRGTVGFKTEKLGENEGQEPFLVEELLSMQLKQIKLNAEGMGAQPASIKDAVITYPPYFTAEEKRSLEFAAELAGLNVVSMISDGLAVGLNYATTRKFPNVSEGKKPEFHIVFDMGAGSTSATLLKFQSRTVKDVGKYNKTVQEVQVAGLGYDKTLGGDAFNQLIVNNMVEKLVDSKLKSVPADKIKAHGKTMAKLWKESERLRQILSANSEAMGFLETLYNEDVNFKYTITRSEFEQLTKEHASRVSQPLTDALTAAGLTLGDVDSIILHGGGTRTPFVQKELEKFGPGKVRTNVNADEAAALGAAFKGAAISPSFRVKEIRAYDAPGYAVGMRWKSGDKERQQKLFNPYSEIGAEKQLVIKNQEDFTFDFYQLFTRGGDTLEYPVLEVKTANLTDSVNKLKEEFECTAANITTKIAVRLDVTDGLPQIVSGNVSCEVHSAEKKGVVDDVKEFFGLGSKKSDQVPLEGDGAEQPIDLDDTASESPSSSSSAETTTASANSSKESEISGKDGKARIESIPIGFTSSPLGFPPLTDEQMQRIKNRLAAFDASDLARVKREEAFNELEGYIYRAQDLLENEDFKKAVTPETLDNLAKQLSTMSDWIHEDGSESGTTELQKNLRGLKDLFAPALKRKTDNAERPLKVDALKQSLYNAKMLIGVMDTQIKAEESLFSASASEAKSTSTVPEDSTSEPSSSSTTSFEEAPSDDSPSSEEDDISSSTTSTTASSSAKPSPTFSLYTPEDLTALSTTHDSISTWLDAQLQLQEKLGDSDEPALTIADLDAKSKELEKSLNKIMAKLARNQGGWNGQSDDGSGKKSKSGKDKTKKTKIKTKTSTTKQEEQATESPKNKHESKDEL